jgi:hypothetical protein
MEDDGEALEGTETVALRVELDLVPEWSNLLERIAQHHGQRVAVGVEGPSFVVKVALVPDRKTVFLADVERHWDLFVERRKREGRWKR